MSEEKINKGADLEDELQIYELGFHILTTIAEENLAAEVSKIKDTIEKSGGFLINEEGLPKSIKLAYSITKKIDNKKTNFDTAYFGWIKFESTPESVLKIEEELKSIPDILRFILIGSVRESSMVTATRPLKQRPTRSAQDKKADSSKKEEISEEQVDQAIEELVVE